MSDTNMSDDKVFIMRHVADHIRSLLMALERDHGVCVQKVDVDCDGVIKFETSIHCSH
jgi:hypothetical protein